MKAKLTALGTYVPEKVLDNNDIEKLVDTSDEWIVQRTGIKERRVVEDGVFTIDLAAKAVENLVEKSKKDLHDVDFIIVATVTPDYYFPSVASQIQHRFNIPATGAIDITAACAGFVYGLILAQGLVEAGTYKKVLVIGAETLTRFTDYTDRATCILFADGAAASLVEASDKTNMFASVTGTDGDGGVHVYSSIKTDKIDGKDIEANGKIHQDGRKVFKWAIETVSRESVNLVEKAGLSLNDIDWFVPHSANQRIIDAISKNINFPVERTLESLLYLGNTSSASIPLAIQKGIDEGKVKKGDKMLLIGFGGGLTYAGIIIEWDA